MVAVIKAVHKKYQRNFQKPFISSTFLLVGRPIRWSLLCIFGFLISQIQSTEKYSIVLPSCPPREGAWGFPQALRVHRVDQPWRGNSVHCTLQFSSLCSVYHRYFLNKNINIALYLATLFALPTCSLHQHNLRNCFQECVPFFIFLSLCDNVRRD